MAAGRPPRSPPQRPIETGATPATGARRQPATTAAIPSRFKLRNIVWTGAFAAVTIVGAIYGAGLKTRQEFKAEQKQFVQAPVQERIRDLEARRAALTHQRRPLQRKLDELNARIDADKKLVGAPTTARVEGDSSKS